jgi:hypothetical protein
MKLENKHSGRDFIMIEILRDYSANCSGEVLPVCSIMPQQTALINLEIKLSGRDFIMIVIFRDYSVYCSGRCFRLVA